MDKPILFNTEMIKAVLEGRKTQTRRVIKKIKGFGNITEFKKSDTKGYDFTFRCIRKLWQDFKLKKIIEKCPYGQVGDKLWVRETFCNADMRWDTCDKLCFRASVKGCRHANYQKGWPSWTPSIFMTKSICRIWLEITDIRVERVQSISWMDCIREGITYSIKEGRPDNFYDTFHDLWDSINEKRGYSWKANPFVWCITFKLLHK